MNVSKGIIKMAALTEEQRDGADAVLYFIRKEARDRFEDSTMTGEEVAAVFVMLEAAEDAIHGFEIEPCENEE